MIGRKIGIALAAATLAAPARADFTFESLFDSVGSSGNKLTYITQVVAGDGGQVGAVVIDGTEDKVVYKLGPDGNLVAATTAASLSDTIFGGGSTAFGEFQSLALTGGSASPLLTWLNPGGGGSAKGIFQYDLGAGAGYRVHVDGDSVGGSPRNIDFTRYDVNASGQTLFSVDRLTATQAIVRGKGSSSGPVVDVMTSAYTEHSTTAWDKHVTNSGWATFVSHTPGREILEAAAPNTTSPSLLVGSSITPNGEGATTINPYTIQDANDGFVLFNAQEGSGHAVFLRNNNTWPGPTYQRLTSELPSSNFGAVGTLTDAGRAAFYADNNGTPSLHYWDGTTVHDVASGGVPIDDGFGNPLTITNPDAPLINDSGSNWVIFQSFLDDGTQAVFAWNPAMPQNEPSIVAQTLRNFTFVENGTPTTVALEELADIAEGGIYRDAFSDDDYLALGIGYFDGTDYVYKVVLTQVPEPSVAGLALLGACGMLLRTRRGR